MAIRDYLAPRPRIASALAGVTRRVGARGLAAKLQRLSTELVVVDIPRSDATIRMLTRGGRDQIAAHLQSDGWTGFEHPMPSVFAACVAAFAGNTLDVGANTGFYSVVATAVSASTKVIAFEPFPPVAFDLQSTLRLNRCTARVTVEPFAVSDAIGEATLFIPLQDHGLIETSASLSGDFKSEFSEAISVPVTTIDAYDAAHPSGPVSVIKIDVESLEAKVFAGGAAVVARDRPIVFFEVLPQGDVETIESFRATHDYVDMRLRETEVVIGDAVCFDQAAWNHALVPAEKTDAVRAILKPIGLSVQSA